MCVCVCVPELWHLAWPLCRDVGGDMTLLELILECLDCPDDRTQPSQPVLGVAGVWGVGRGEAVVD